jgi:hypothetical protein
VKYAAVLLTVLAVIGAGAHQALAAPSTRAQHLTHPSAGGGWQRFYTGDPQAHGDVTLGGLLPAPRSVHRP